LDNNSSPRVEIPKPPGEGWILNPNRPKNPFDQTTEPDWIKVTTTQIPVSAKKPPLPPPRRQQSEIIPSSSQDLEISRRPSSASLDGRSKPPVPPKPSFISLRGAMTAAPPRNDQSKPKPPMPPRTQTQDVQRVAENGKVGLLMDDDGETGSRVLGGWVPLQPSKEL
jgi:hypothetical protein